MNGPILHRGKLARTPKVIGVRPLTREDMTSLRAERPVPRTKLMRETHHRIARMVAAGIPGNEILSMCGISSTRLLTLRRDPAFIELVAAYKDKVDESWVRSQDHFHEMAVSNMTRAEAMIEEHLDNADESGEMIPLKTLLMLMSDRADRFGYGKKSSVKQEVMNFADVMAEMARASGKSNVIDATPNSSTIAESSAPLVPDGDGGQDA